MDILINIMHAKRLYPVLPQDLLLPPINVPQANIHQFLQTQSLLVSQPPKHIRLLFLCQPRQKSNGHTMNIPAFARLRRIDIRMRVHPNHRHFPAQSFLDGSRRARDGADRDGVIAAQRQHQPAVLRVLVHLVGKLLGDGADGERVLHVAVVWVGGGHEAGVIVHRVVVVEGVAQVLFQLGEEAGGYEGGGGGVDAWFALLEGGG